MQRIRRVSGLRASAYPLQGLRASAYPLQVLRASAYPLLLLRPPACALLAALASMLLATSTSALPLAGPAAPATDAVSAGQSTDLARLMSALAQRKHGHVTFVEHKYLSILDRPVESSGELLYDAPDRLEKRTVKPKPEDLVLQGGVLTAQRGRHQYELNLQQYPQVVPFIESIRATLAGDQAALERVFNVTFGGSFDRWTLTLVPLDAKLAKTVRQIEIAGEAASVHSVEIREADGDRSELTIGPEVGQ